MHTGTYVPVGQSERLARMSSRTHGDQGTPTTPSVSVPADFPPDTGSAPAPRGGDHRRRRRWTVPVLVVALVLALAAGGYLFAVARAWEDRAEEVDGVARDLGAELASAQADLEETRGTLALVETQLEGAQEQIHELADTVAQSGDDREVQRQVLEYQTELFAAAAGVTGTMAGCISDQQDYVVALEGELNRRIQAERAQEEESPSPAQPDPGDQPDLPALRDALITSCQAAAEAHEDLTRRMSDS